MKRLVTGVIDNRVLQISVIEMTIIFTLKIIDFEENCCISHKKFSEILGEL